MKSIYIHKYNWVCVTTLLRKKIKRQMIGFVHTDLAERQKVPNKQLTTEQPNHQINVSCGGNRTVPCSDKERIYSEMVVKPFIFLYESISRPFLQTKWKEPKKSSKPKTPKTACPGGEKLFQERNLQSSVEAIQEKCVREKSRRRDTPSGPSVRLSARGRLGSSTAAQPWVMICGVSLAVSGQKADPKWLATPLFC